MKLFSTLKWADEKMKNENENFKYRNVFVLSDGLYEGLKKINNLNKNKWADILYKDQGTNVSDTIL